MFFNALTADDKYSLLNTDNLSQPIRTPLPQKERAFSEFLLAFSKSTLKFEHFQKKDYPIADFFPKLRSPKNVVRYKFKKSSFKGPFERQHGTLVQTLL